MNESEKNAILLSHYQSMPYYEELAERIQALFKRDPSLPVELYVIKQRTKDPERLIEKVDECNKHQTPPPINSRNYQAKIGDILGIRIICFRLSDVKKMDQFIRSLKTEGKLIFPTPENKRTFVLPVEPGEGSPAGIDLQYSGYSSVHYMVRLGKALSPPSQLSKLRAEIQLRTIFEEAWSEVDHRYRYRLARKGLKVPNHISRGFYNLSAYLQGVALQAEHICQEAEKIPTRVRRPRRRKAVAPRLAPAPSTIGEAVVMKLGFDPTGRTIAYIHRRLEDALIFADEAQRLYTEVLTDDAIGEFRQLYRDVLGGEPFTEPAVQDIDLLNLVNYWFFKRIEPSDVAKEGLRSVLRGRL